MPGIVVRRPYIAVSNLHQICEPPFKAVHPKLHELVSGHQLRNNLGQLIGGSGLEGAVCY